MLGFSTPDPGSEQLAPPRPPQDCRQHYQIAMPDPASHLFEITLRFEQVNRQDPWLLQFPVWTPGSYLVRDYARFGQDFRAVMLRGSQVEIVPCRKTDKHTWQIPPDPSLEQRVILQVQYRLYAHELTVRTNHLDPSHGYFNGAATFLYAPERRQEPLLLTVQLPDPAWQVATCLAQLHRDPQSVTLWADSFDQVVDSPVEVGIHQQRNFEVMGKPHQLVVWGEGNIDLDQVVQDIQQIVPATADYFGSELPYERYLFLLHLSAHGFGGLEHRDCTSLLYSRFGFRQVESYRRFLALVAHEFFHVWNVKRLRPLALETYDYQQESYLTCLWFCEGATSYYENRILLKRGLINSEQFLTLLSERITRFEQAPGKLVQALSESSFDTWIKLYRPHENTANSQVSYYLKGAIVCWLLDLQIRHQSQGSHCFDDVMLDLWQRFGRSEKGYTDQDLQQACEQAAGGSLEDWFAHYIDSPQPLDYSRHLDPFGLILKSAYSSPDPAPYLGLACREGSTITAVDMGSPAQRAGIWAGDELLAVEGFRVTGEMLQERLKDYQPGQTVTLTVFQQDQLQTLPVRLDPPCPDRYWIERDPHPSAAQQLLYQQWMGLDSLG